MLALLNFESAVEDAICRSDGREIPLRKRRLYPYRQFEVAVHFSGNRITQDLAFVSWCISYDRAARPEKSLDPGSKSDRARCSTWRQFGSFVGL